MVWCRGAHSASQHRQQPFFAAISCWQQALNSHNTLQPVLLLCPACPSSCSLTCRGCQRCTPRSCGLTGAGRSPNHSSHHHLAGCGEVWHVRVGEDSAYTRTHRRRNRQPSLPGTIFVAPRLAAAHSCMPLTCHGFHKHACDTADPNCHPVTHQ